MCEWFLLMSRWHSVACGHYHQCSNVCVNGWMSPLTTPLLLCTLYWYNIGISLKQCSSWNVMFLFAQLHGCTKDICAVNEMLMEAAHTSICLWSEWDYNVYINCNCFFCVFPLQEKLTVADNIPVIAPWCERELICFGWQWHIETCTFCIGILSFN